MTRLSAPWLSASGLVQVFSVLEAAGHAAFAVGGCVRDTLLGLPVKDIDIATDATPDRVEDLMEGAGLRTVPTGKEHGTITVIAGGESYELTTFRRDVSTDGRRAKVAFAGTMAEDAARRDLTLNALYADARGMVHDPLGGLPDLEARRVRFIGDPTARIREDYLRILRFFRFSARFSSEIDAEGLAAVAAEQDGLGILAAERVTQELTALLALADPGRAIAAMGQTGILSRLLPGADPTHLPAVIHLEAQAGLPPSWRRRLTTLGGSRDGLRLSKADMAELDRQERALSEARPAAARTYLHGAEAAWTAALMEAAILATPLPPTLGDEIARGAAQTFPLRAMDLPEHLEGPAIGQALKALEAYWIKTDFAASPSALVAHGEAIRWGADHG
ncbi:MAG: CCA tRNA nucleotidyltransferase [Pseudomonadota bacterium]